MTTYQVIEKFYLYEYNPKTRAMKQRAYHVGETVTETVYRRMTPAGQQRYLNVL